MKLELVKKKEENKENVNSISYTDLPLDYLRDEYPQVYQNIAKRYKAVDSYIYIRNI